MHWKAFDGIYHDVHTIYQLIAPHTAEKVRLLMEARQRDITCRYYNSGRTAHVETKFEAELASRRIRDVHLGHGALVA